MTFPAYSGGAVSACPQMVQKKSINGLGCEMARLPFRGLTRMVGPLHMGVNVKALHNIAGAFAGFPRKMMPPA